MVAHDRVLIARRMDSDRLGGKWEFPGGKIEIGETPEKCLIREMKEEFGIDVAVKEFFAENIHTDDSRTIRLMAYHTVWQSGDFSLNAHSAIKWVSMNQLNKYDFAPADKPLVEKLIGVHPKILTSNPELLNP